MDYKEYNDVIINAGKEALKTGSAYEQGGKENGAVGKSFEKIVVRYFTGRDTQRGISAKAGTDFTFQKERYECKQNQGCIETVKNSKYVVYTVVWQGDDIGEGYIENTAFVIPTEQFLDGVKMILNTKLDQRGKLYMQYFKNSQRKTAKWLDFIGKYPTIEQWYEIKTGKKHKKGWE